MAALAMQEIFALRPRLEHLDCFGAKAPRNDGSAIEPYRFASIAIIASVAKTTARFFVRGPSGSIHA